jgi:hypothetical protein
MLVAAERAKREEPNMKKVATSLSNVIRTVQDSARSDAEAVAVLTVMLGSGRVAFARDVRRLLAARA